MFNNSNNNQSPYTTEQLMFALQQSQQQQQNIFNQMNPALYNQFLQQQQQQQQSFPADGSMFQIQQAQAFEAMQRLQALAQVQEEEQQVALQAAFLAQQQALVQQGMAFNQFNQFQQQNDMEVDTNGPLKITPPNKKINDSQSVVDSALGSAVDFTSSASQSPRDEFNLSSPNKETAQLQQLVAANPSVHVPCTAKCYHRCKLGLSCPRHQHKHLDKLRRKQKQAQEAATGKTVQNNTCTQLPTDKKGHIERKKSLETSSTSCVSIGSDHIKKNDGMKRTFLDLYEVYNVIGVGGGGMVYSGRRISDKLPVAIKRVMREKVKRWEQVQGHNVPQEIALMLRCYGHPNVIMLVDWYECLDSFILIMEKPERAVDLFDYIREIGKMKEPHACKVFKQILSATMHIHSKGVVHRDIKDENIIINRDTQEAKLIDFGCGTILKETAYRDFSGTPEFYPPEWFTQREYFARTAAVWSLGVLLFDMLMGEIPFKQKEKIVENNPKYKHAISDQAKHLVQWMMSNDPKDRPTLQEIAEHPWMQQN
jgi:proto-oncogene serine/threonine-protein kinase Pim-3